MAAKHLMVSESKALCGRMVTQGDGKDCGNCARVQASKDVWSGRTSKAAQSLASNVEAEHTATVTAHTMANGDTAYTAECGHGWATGFHTTHADAEAVALGHGEVTRPLYVTPVSAPTIEGYEWKRHVNPGEHVWAGSTYQLVQTGSACNVIATVKYRGDGLWAAQSATWGNAGLTRDYWKGEPLADAFANVAAFMGFLVRAKAAGVTGTELGRLDWRTWVAPEASLDASDIAEDQAQAWAEAGHPRDAQGRPVAVISVPANSTECVCYDIWEARQAGAVVPTGGLCCPGCGSTFTMEGDELSEATQAACAAVIARNATYQGADVNVLAPMQAECAHCGQDTIGRDDQVVPFPHECATREQIKRATSSGPRTFADRLHDELDGPSPLPRATWVPEVGQWIMWQGFAYMVESRYSDGHMNLMPFGGYKGVTPDRPIAQLIEWGEVKRPAFNCINCGPRLSVWCTYCTPCDAWGRKTGEPPLTPVKADAVDPWVREESAIWAGTDIEPMKRARLSRKGKKSLEKAFRADCCGRADHERWCRTWRPITKRHAARMGISRSDAALLRPKFADLLAVRVGA